MNRAREAFLEVYNKRFKDTEGYQLPEDWENLSIDGWVWDSLDKVETYIELESKLDIEIPDEVSEDWVYFIQILEHIEKELKKKEPELPLKFN